MHAEGAFVTAEFSYETHLRKIPDDDRILCAKVSYARLHGNREPYLSITGETFSRRRCASERRVEFGGYKWWCDSLGMLQEDIAKTFPELVPYLDWHLAGPSGPMYYLENGQYFLRLCRYTEPLGGMTMLLQRVRERAHTRSTLLLGALPDDLTLDELLELSPDACTAYLTQRQEPLVAKFHETLDALRALKEPLTCPTPSAKTKKRSKPRTRSTSTSGSSPLPSEETP